MLFLFSSIPLYRGVSRFSRDGVCLLVVTLLFYIYCIIFKIFFPPVMLNSFQHLSTYNNDSVFILLCSFKKLFLHLI